MAAHPHAPTKIAIVGFDREGKSVLRFLRRTPRYRVAEFWVLDRNPAVARHVPRGVHAQLGEHYLDHLEQFDLISRTPGAHYLKPEFVRARRHGVRFTSATKLFFEAAAGKTRHLIGVTGTKGKGTTSTLLSRMLAAAKKPILLAGNIGTPMLDVLPKIRRSSFVVLELSSFQLQDLDRSPRTAVVLDLFPDHQDAHRSLKEYYSAKANVAAHQRPGDRTFFFADQPLGRRTAATGRGKKIAVDPRRFTLFGPGDLALRGDHNFRNAAMAATVAMALGVPRAIARRSACSFNGNPHRLELVRKVMVRQAHHRSKSAIYFYNDSASTNPHTSAAAVRAFADHPLILLAGGQDKNLDCRPLADALRRHPAALVILYGENRMKIRRALARNTPVRTAHTLREALRIGYRAARSLPPHPSSLTPVVLLSPGAASFDQFMNYADRGDRFKKFVKAL